MSRQCTSDVESSHATGMPSMEHAIKTCMCANGCSVCWRLLAAAAIDKDGQAYLWGSNRFSQVQILRAATPNESQDRLMAAVWIVPAPDVLLLSMLQLGLESDEEQPHPTPVRQLPNIMSIALGVASTHLLHAAPCTLCVISVAADSL